MSTRSPLILSIVLPSVPSTLTCARLTAMACSLVLLGCGGTPPTPLAPAATAAATATEATTAPISPEAEPAITTASAVAEAAEALAGTWDCNGSVFGPEGPSPSRVTLDTKLALDSAWLQTEFAVASGSYPYKFNAYRTFVASSGTWVNLIVDNLGGHTLSESTDSITWTGTSTSPMGEMKIKDSETLHSPGKMTLLGQYSLDDGTTWNTGYELSCER